MQSINMIQSYDFTALFDDVKTIAVVGLSPKQQRPSNMVARYMLDNGFYIIPVNPGQDDILGCKCYSDISSVPEKVDMVNIFRKSEDVLPIVQDIVGKSDLPKVIWMQQGIVNEAAAKLAKKHGIEGFCYYHYWFNGQRLLERPLEEVLKSGKPDFPFCMCWANENWTRRWDGDEQHVLMKQEYSEADDRAHIRSLIPVFEDKRYIRIDGKPFFLVYRTENMPDPGRTAEIWREEARKAIFD